MSNRYTKALEYFVENGLPLNESIVNDLKNKFENRNNIKKTYTAYYMPFTNKHIPDTFDTSIKSKLRSIFLSLDPKDSIADIVGIVTNNSSKAIKEDKPFIFNKTKELDKKYTLYTFSIYVSSKKPIEDDIEFYSSNVVEFNGKVTKKETNTLKYFLDKYHIKYEVVDANEKFKDRIKIYNEILAITKKTLFNFKSKGSKDGFGIINRDDEFNKETYESFIYGQTDEFDIVECSIYDYYENKKMNYRDFDLTKDYFDDTTKLQKELNKALRKYGTVDYGGDWDDGPIYIKVKSK